MGHPPTAERLGSAELRSALASPDPSTRAQGLLRAAAAPGVEELAVEALLDQEPEVRVAAVQALSRLGSPKGTTALMEAAAGDPSPSVRAAALAALGGILEARSPRTGPDG